MIKLRQSSLKIIAMLYIIMPIFLFFLGWLKLFISLPITIILLFGVYRFVKSKYDVRDDTNNFLSVRKSHIFFVVVIMLIWSFLAGQGGFFYQSSDHNYRNAILRDLINYDWPVIYSRNTAMVYYIGHWLVPGIIGKVFTIILGSQVGWLVGNIFLYLWTSIGLIIVALLLIYTVKANNFRKIALSLSVLALFSGLDIIGTVISKGVSGISLHIEWWADLYQFSSNTTLLFWVFNQTIVPWIVVLLFLNERKIQNYALLSLSILPFAPMPFVGMLPFFICSAIQHFLHSIKAKNIRPIILDILSIQNITAIITILPVFLFYFSSNASSTNGIRLDFNLINSFSGLARLITFWSLEVGIYAFVLFFRNKNNIFYYIVVLSLLLIPVFKIGNSADFAMRASISALFFLMIFTIKFLFENIGYINKKCYTNTPIMALILVFTLLIGTATPLIEFTRAFVNVFKEGRINVVADHIKTLADKNFNGQIDNFITKNIKEEIFFKYLAK